MSKKLVDIFANAEVPVILCVANGETENTEEIAFTRVVDKTSGKKVTLLANNASKMKSPITGEDVVIAENAIPDTASFDAKETLSTLVCVANCIGCNHDIYVTPEVAESVDNKVLYCTNCGEKVTALYDGDLVVADEDPENPDDIDSNDGEITDALDEDTEEDDDGDDDVTDDSAKNDDGNAVGETPADDSTEEASKSETASDDDEDDAGDDDNSDDVNSDDDDDSDDADSSEDDTNTGDDSSDDDDSGDDDSDSDDDDDAGDAGDPDEDDEDDALDEEEENAATVVIASAIDFTDKLLSFATTANTERYEVFLGDDHIGSLNKANADENVQRIYAKPDLVRNAFGSSFWKNTAEIAKGNFAALASYGFAPAKITVPFSKVVANELSTMESEFETKTEEAIKTANDQVIATLKIAMAGLDKGLFSGPNLYQEVAKCLKSFGIQKAEEASARFVENFSSTYFNAVVEQAEKLRTKSAEYVSGLNQAIETASYSHKPAEASQADYLSTSSLLPEVASTTRKPEVKQPVIPAKQASDKYRGIFRKY